MAEGFYVTNKGIELINQAVTAGTKVDIKKVKYGSGGDSVSPWNYDIQSLGHEEYSKDLDPITDSYKVSESDPKTFIITTIVPNETECTINEIGFFDSQDNLIVYGIVREDHKRAGVKFQYETYVKFENVDETAVEITIVSPEYEKVEQLVETTKAELEQLIQRAESDFDLSNYVSHEEYQKLLDMVDSSNAIMEEYVG